MISQGLVGFFDILGYQNIIDNNTIEEVSKIITEVLFSLPGAVMAEMKKGHCEPVWDKMKMKLKNLEATLISDSILVVLALDLKKSVWEKLFSVSLFERYIEGLMGATFREGLPVRGAIDFGDYFVEDRSFAGKPIINCYRLGQSLDFSGGVMTKECSAVMDSVLLACRKEDADACEVWEGFMGYDYLCPLRDQKWERHRVIDWSLWTGDEMKDVRGSVFKAFKDHNKDVGPDVIRKMENTEMMLRFFKSKWKVSGVKGK
ncbi:MAG: hypothetical protein NTW68_13730 [candidate division NC10 bacterium]|nr:hypothetical protein [candidate division NC10 bacterium]